MAQVEVLLNQLVAGVPAVKAFLLLLFTLLSFLLRRYFAAGGGGAAAGDRKSRLPPFPPALPLFGHLHLVSALPRVSLRRLAKWHGREDLMMLRLGTVSTLVASSPRAAQAVLRTHDQSFASRPRSAVGDVLTYGFADIGFAPYGERWRQAKKLVSTHLLSAKKVQSYRAAREEEVSVVVVLAKIRDAAATAVVVDMSKLLSTFTNDMMCRAVAGRSFRVEGRNKVFRELIDAGMALLGGFSLDNFYPDLAKVAGGVLMWPARRRAERLRDRRWDVVLDKLIDEHTSGMAGNGSDHQEETTDSDFMHVLLSVQEEYGLTRNNIKGILAEMFAAGTTTAYLVLEFTMAELMLNEDVMTKLQAEVRSSIREGQNAINEEHLTGMTYLKAIIKETLRLHPPSPLFLPHFSKEDCVVDGYTIPAGTTMFVNAWAIGRDPKIWDAAEKFMPERREKSMDLTLQDKTSSFCPLGRVEGCAQEWTFALASVEIVLASLVYHFDWKLPKGTDNIDMTEVFGLAVSRKEKLLLTPMSRGTVRGTDGEACHQKKKYLFKHACSYTLRFMCCYLPK